MKLINENLTVAFFLDRKATIPYKTLVFEWFKNFFLKNMSKYPFFIRAIHLKKQHEFLKFDLENDRIRPNEVIKCSCNLTTEAKTQIGLGLLKKLDRDVLLINGWFEVDEIEKES